MKTEHSNGGPADSPGRSIEEAAALYGVNLWTVRMWVDRFETLERSLGADGKLTLSPRAVEQIGEICRLAKTGMKLDDVRKYFESTTP